MYFWFKGVVGGCPHFSLWNRPTLPFCLTKSHTIKWWNLMYLLSNERCFHPWPLLQVQKDVPVNCLNKTKLKLVYVYNILSLVSIWIVDNIRKYVGERVRKLLQTFAYYRRSSESTLPNASCNATEINSLPQIWNAEVSKGLWLRDRVAASPTCLDHWHRCWNSFWNKMMFPLFQNLEKFPLGKFSASQFA